MMLLGLSLLYVCASLPAGRLAKTASQTGEVLLNGRRKTNLSYGIAVNVFSHKIHFTS
jgi:hypothetical protein